MSSLRSKIEEVKREFRIIGNSPKLNLAIELALRIAPTDINVLVVGPSGSGKEFIPHIIHRYSMRRDKNLIIVNCGAIPEGTINSELFGHEKGAFTGAYESRRGYFEEADGGTLFLDEVAELPLPTQARLLRAIESGEIMRVGSSRTIKVDVRIVAATNIDLLSAVRKNRFREDLYYRIAGVVIKMPALSERKEDIPLLVKAFMVEINEKYGIPVKEFTEDAYGRLMEYEWPGNVRQLKHLVEQIMFLEEGKMVTGEVVIRHYERTYGTKRTALASLHRDEPREEYSPNWNMLITILLSIKRDTDELLKLLREREEKPLPVLPPLEYGEMPQSEIRQQENGERERIISALKKYHGHRGKAAKELGISERTLYRKIKAYNITRDDIFNYR